MSTLCHGRESGEGAGHSPFEGGQPRLPFEVVAGGDFSRRLPVDKVDGLRPTPTPWREVDTGAGAPVIVCHACWPQTAERLRGQSGVEVRVLYERPEWARCAVCDPEQVC